MFEETVRHFAQTVVKFYAYRCVKHFDNILHRTTTTDGIPTAFMRLVQRRIWDAEFCGTIIVLADACASCCGVCQNDVLHVLPLCAPYTPMIDFTCEL